MIYMHTARISEYLYIHLYESIVIPPPPLSPGLNQDVFFPCIKVANKIFFLRANCYKSSVHSKHSVGVLLS